VNTRKANPKSEFDGPIPEQMQRYYIIYKPFQILSQFTSPDNKRSLKDLSQFPSDVYPVGRLDYDSEGLLILTNDASLNHFLLNPRFGHEREYWVQVEGRIDPSSIRTISTGVEISINGKNYRTKKCKAAILGSDLSIPDRNPPIRFRKNIPSSWISLVLTEGKNRQVRKMTAKIGFPTLRLIRHRVEGLNVDGMKPGEIKELTKEEIYAKLSIHLGHGQGRDSRNPLKKKWKERQ